MRGRERKRGSAREEERERHRKRKVERGRVWNSEDWKGRKTKEDSIIEQEEVRNR